MATFPVDTLKFYYEDLGDSPEFISEKTMVPKETIITLIKAGNWQRRPLTKEKTQKVYSSTRQYATLHQAHRSRLLLAKFARMEDSAIERLTEAFDQIDFTAKGVDATQTAATITRMVTALSKLMGNHTIIQEAITTPALIERKGEGVSDASLHDLLNALDGAGRSLPGQAPEGEEI